MSTTKRKPPTDQATTDDASVTVRPANEASWEDLQTVFTEGGDASGCQCQWFKLSRTEWRSTPRAERAADLRRQTACGHPEATHTTGLVAYLGEEPVGWCAVEPRTAYPRLQTARVPWAGRDEVKSDASVWAITCFVTRHGFRNQGVSRALARAAVEYARAHGASAVEGYARHTTPGAKQPAGPLFVGTPSIFASAGLTEVSRPTPGRVVMRIDLVG
ncbi:MAG: GNAT family N-acetyltransferase [Trueperaceae bacterium]|nr:GNAT family N-acetyltransferase [Trueperaceae bacterium]MCO5174779.1 GNAT family N-acetyltransferase [Trueperaceae bacterium]MCW5819955.1 GNAT family N-acetyltransferase [Trueperaceae bacterium]